MADLNDLLAKSKSTDQLALLKAKEAAKKKMSTDPKPGDIEVFKQTQAALEQTDAPAPDLPGRIFRTQMEGVKFLNGQGYKIGRDKFSRHVNDGLIPKHPSGGFEASALLGYAGAHCEPLASAINRETDSAALERMKADTANKMAMAERNRLKLERERGNLMPRDEHETDLAARAAFFKREVETLGRRLGPRLIHLVGGDEDRLPAFLEFWNEETAVWLDAYSRDREFVIGDQEADDQNPELSTLSSAAQEQLDFDDEEDDEL